MFRVVLVPVVILAVVICCCVPLPVVASVLASGLLWRLFVAYKHTLVEMSGVELGRAGLLEGYGVSSGVGLGGELAGSAGAVTSGRFEVSEPFSHAKTSDQVGNSVPSGRYPGAGSSGRFPGSASSLRGAAESSRSSSRSGALDDELSPLSSPSVSILSRSSYKENLSYRSDDRTRGPPMLPPGSYPWLMPSAGSAIKKRINLESVPVKIKVSKPTTSFLSTPDVTEEQPRKIDSSKQIIQALKAMSRKRLHTSVSDDSHEESFGAIPKRRPIDYHHNLVESHLESYGQGIPEILEGNAISVETATANGSESNLNASSNPILSSVPNSEAVNNAPPSNKRPRAAHDSGSQAAKKRNQTNNEILSSLSSSLALLDPNIIHGRLGKRRESDTKVPAKRIKSTETHCVEVQTLPSPIMKEDPKRNKEDKGTATDRIVEGNKSSTYSTQTVGITEKKVTSTMAAALLKSALMKFANSGELVTPDTSANSNSVLGETSLSKSDVGDKTETQKSVRFTLPETPTSAESVIINGTSSVPSLTAAVTLEQPSKSVPAFNFGSSSLQTGSAVTSSTALVTASVTPITATSLSTAAPAADKPGFTLGNENSMAITPSPTEAANTFSYGSTAGSQTPAVSTAPKSSEAPGSVPSSTGFKFGTPTTSDQPKPSFTFGAPPTTSTPSLVPTSQKEPAPVATSVEIKQSPFSFGQSSTAPAQQAQTGTGGFKLGGSTMAPVSLPSSAAPAALKPGGFSFTPSAKYSFGSSTTAATSTVATPTASPSATAPSSITSSATLSTQPSFSFGNSSFGSKPKNLFGMPPPPSKTPSSTSEPPKVISPFGGFAFTSPSKDQQPGFTGTPQKPEEKKQEGFVFGGGGLGQKTEAKPFSFGGSGTSEQAKPAAPAFNFGASSAPQPAFGANSTVQTTFGAGSGTQPAFSVSSGTQPAFGSFTSKPADPTGGSIFNPPATTSSTLFGSNVPLAATPGKNSVVPFGLTATKTTAPTFGGSAMTATTSANQTLTFGSGLTSMASPAPSFGSATPAFGSTLNNFGSSGTAFGSGTASFGSANPPSFGSLGTPVASTANPPAPTFGSGTVSTPQFGSPTFSAASAPAFGSAFGAAPAFGTQQPTAQQTAPTFGGPQTTTPSVPAFGAAQTTTQPALPSFGVQQATTQPSAPAFGAQPSSTPAPFSFSASAQPAAPASGGFSFQPSGAPQSMFQFGAAGAPAQPSAPQPFAFSGGSAPAPGIGGGFGNTTMFSIGSGTAAPRSRTTLRTRKK